MSQVGKQTVAIHILQNISRNKGHQTIKCDQLIEYNMRNVLPENPQNVVEKLVLDPFHENQN